MRNLKTRTAFLAMAVMGLAISGKALAAYSVVEVKNGGSITGTVKWSGDVPKAKMITPGVDKQICHVGPEEALVINEKTLGIKNAVVVLLKIKKGKKFASKRVTLDQKGCMYAPRVVVAPVKGEVAFQSSDPVTHNVHIYTKRNRSFNLILPPRAKGSDKAEPVVKSFARSDRIMVKCDIHSWMKGWILVSSHPYRVVTDENGKFNITDIPPGTYKIAVWHEQAYSKTRTKGVPMLSFKSKSLPVKVESGKSVTKNFVATKKAEPTK